MPNTTIFPIWYSNPSLTSFGGAPNLHDYLDSGPIDPTTDLSAFSYNAICEAVQMMAKTAPFAVLTIDPSADGYLVSYRGFNGIGVSQGPAITKNGVGDFTLTFDTTYQDSFGQMPAISLGAALVTCLDTSSGYAPVCQVVNNHALRIRTFSGSSAGDKVFCAQVMRTV